MLKCILSLFLIIPSTVNAADFSLKIEPQSSYVSLNECIYAISRAIKIAGMPDNVYLYKDELWSASFNQKSSVMSCKLLGRFSE